MTMGGRGRRGAEGRPVLLAIRETRRTTTWSSPALAEQSPSRSS